MSPEEQYIRPPSLRIYLESGGDLTGFALLDSLVEAVVVARRLLPAETNRKQAARNRRFVERWFARHGGEEPVPATQELLTFAFWKAECLEDPSLADLFEATLPPDTLDRALQLVDDLRHVHPLAVREEMENWTCRACGETFVLAPAAVVTNTGEELGYDEDLSYCLGCMSIATSALEAASGIDRFTEGLDDERHRLRPVGRMTDALGGLGGDSDDDDDYDDELILVDGAVLAFDDDDDSGELVFDDDVETVRSEAARLTTQLEAAARRMAALEARRAALIAPSARRAPASEVRRIVVAVGSVGTGTAWGWPARLQATVIGPRVRQNQLASSSQVGWTSSKSPSDRAGRRRRRAISARCHSSRPAWGSLSSSAQSRTEPSNVARSWGSGTASGFQPKAANSLRRPSLTRRPSSGSTWSVKYWNGVEAPHSSPWKSIGTNGAHSTRAAAMRRRPVLMRAEERSPAARLPTWSWFWR
jgi:hypothetical protein